jgi:hypothetical protein
MPIISTSSLASLAAIDYDCEDQAPLAHCSSPIHQSQVPEFCLRLRALFRQETVTLANRSLREKGLEQAGSSATCSVCAFANDFHRLAFRVAIDGASVRLLYSSAFAKPRTHQVGDGARPRCHNCQTKGSTCQWGMKASFHASRSQSLSVKDSLTLAAIEQQRKRRSSRGQRSVTVYQLRPLLHTTSN